MKKFALVVALAVLIPAMANATCSDDATALAQKYGVTASLASPSSSSSETLAKTGGVIAPPPTGDMAAATPAMSNTDHMDTSPAIPPQTAGGTPLGSVQAKKAAKAEGNAAADTQAASLLQAAREAGLKGDEATCQQSLADAKALLQKAPAETQ